VAENDADVENPNSPDYSIAVPAVGNPEYFDRDANDASTSGLVDDDDEGSYLTCAAAKDDYYDYNGGQLIAA